MKVLLIIEQCNPNWPSVPLVGFQLFQALNAVANVTLVTHGRNQADLEQHTITPKRIVYLHESAFIRNYYRIATAWLPGGMANWPLYHVLTYPIYAEFNHQVYRQFKAAVAQGEYDIVHVITPMMPRYPVKLIRACGATPFVLGPVNGGIPFPKGFSRIAAQEFAYLNFFRALGRWLIPGYLATYRKADHILAGSVYTRDWLQDGLGVSGDRLALLPENGLDALFLQSQPRTLNGDLLRILFVGRLVPYKCADLVIAAIAQLSTAEQQRVQLTIVGDGPQRQFLVQQVQQLHLGQQVQFVGWVPQAETRPYYLQADVFCFPSIREFGGAVVLEAMACGLPCIVADYGGIGEYVTPETGFKLPPTSREALTAGIVESLQILLHEPDRYTQLSQAAIQRAATFSWSNKAQQILKHYQTLIDCRPSVHTFTS